MKRIVLTGGGTAGHVTPNIALLPKLKELGYDIHYIGSYEGIEKKLITDFNIPYYGVATGKLRRYFDVKNLSDPFRVMTGYGDAKKIHDEWENIYINRMDFSRLELYTDAIVSQLISGKHKTLEGIRLTGFFGASTPDGAVNYIEPLTASSGSRYFIKGRPGTGKSTFLKKLASSAERMGYDTNVYYCSFDKNSLDMVLIPDLSVAVFDSTRPHEIFPSRAGDKILDFYTESGLEGTDEKMSAELKYISGKYSNKIKEGMAYLRLGNVFMQELEYYYEQNLDENGICLTADKLLNTII